MNDKKNENFHETIIHTPADFPYNTYPCSIPLDFESVKLHWHTEIEIIAVKNGKGIISVDLKKYDVNAGDVIFVFPGQLHSIEQKNCMPMDYENIIFKPELLKNSGIDICTDNFLRPLFGRQTNIEPLVRDERINALIDELDALCIQKPYGYQLAIKSALFGIMFRLVGEHSSAEFKSASPKKLEKIKTVLTFVEDNFRSPITIDEIAGVVFYSRSHFMEFFKTATGKSFIEYLNDYRLEKAAEILRLSGDNIIDIAAAVGFDNLSYFNRCFKKKFGAAPGEYRRSF